MKNKSIGEPYSSFHAGPHTAVLRSWPILHYASPVPQMAVHLGENEVTTLPCAYCARSVYGSKANEWVHNDAS